MFLCVNTVSDKFVRYLLAYLSVQNNDFQSIFARSASAVTPKEKSSINTNRKSTTSFPMSLRWTVYVAPEAPKGGSKTQSVQNLNSDLR